MKPNKQDFVYSTDQLRNKILYYINYRLRTKKEVCTKLETLNATQEQQNLLIFEFMQSGLINDEKFIGFFIKDYIEIKKHSLFKLRVSLSRIGFSKPLIDHHLSLYTTEENFCEEEQASIILKEKYRYHQKIPDDQKILAFLGRRGFSYNTSTRALKIFHLNILNKSLNN